MYRNIGNKIKGLAVLIAVLGAVGSIIAGLFVIEGGNQLEILSGVPSYDGAQNTKIVGVVLIILGPILSWINSFILYGYGELITQSQIANDTLDNVESMLKKIRKAPLPAPAPEPKKPTKWTCPSCGNVNEMTKDQCAKCAKYRPIQV